MGVSGSLLEGVRVFFASPPVGSSRSAASVCVGGGAWMCNNRYGNVAMVTSSCSSFPFECHRNLIDVQ